MFPQDILGETAHASLTYPSVSHLGELSEDQGGKELAPGHESLGWEERLQRERVPTPVFWPGEFHGLYSPWGGKESDTTERLSLSLMTQSVPDSSIWLFLGL